MNLVVVYPAFLSSKKDDSSIPYKSFSVYAVRARLNLPPRNGRSNQSQPIKVFHWMEELL